MHNSENHFLNKHEPIDKKMGGNLPHWEQEGKIQFITFRLADSLPQTKICELKQAKLSFLKNNPEPWDEETKLKFWQNFNPTIENLLHNGYGSCILRSQEIRDLLIQTIFFHNNVRYKIISYIIMPNHVHLLLLVFYNEKLSEILKSIKGFSAKQINKFLNSQGKIWMSESFDRIIRNSSHLNHCINYIKNNPENLTSGEYEFYISKDYT